MLSEDHSVSADRLLVVRRSQVVVALSWTTALLVATSVALDAVNLFTGHDRVFGLLPLFSLDSESNVPTLFSATLLLLASALLGLNGSLAPTAGRARLYWRVLAYILLLMTVDEAARIHELTSEPVHRVVRGLGPAFRFAWVIPAMILTVIAGVLFLPFLLSLPRRTRFGFVLAGGIYVCGAIGMELIGGTYLGRGRFQVDAGYVVIYTIEETLEMVGMIVFINTLLAHIESHTPEGRWRVQRS